MCPLIHYWPPTCMLWQDYIIARAFKCLQCDLLIRFRDPPIERSRLASVREGCDGWSWGSIGLKDKTCTKCHSNGKLTWFTYWLRSQSRCHPAWLNVGVSDPRRDYPGWHRSQVDGRTRFLQLTLWIIDRTRRVIDQARGRFLLGMLSFPHWLGHCDWYGRCYESRETTLVGTLFDRFRFLYVWSNHYSWERFCSTWSQTCVF